VRARTRALELTGDLSRLQRAYDSVQQELGNNRYAVGFGGGLCRWMLRYRERHVWAVVEVGQLKAGTLLRQRAAGAVQQRMCWMVLHVPHADRMHKSRLGVHPF
jgi:hypothetical protein